MSSYDNHFGGLRTQLPKSAIAMIWRVFDPGDYCAMGVGGSI